MARSDFGCCRHFQLQDGREERERLRATRVSGLSVPPPRVSTSSMVDCPARFIRQIGRGREGAGNSEQLQDHRRAVLSGGGREEEQQEDPLRASAAAAPPPLSPPHVSRVYAAATVHTTTGHTRVNLRPYGANGVRSTRCLRRRRP